MTSDNQEFLNQFSEYLRKMNITESAVINDLKTAQEYLDFIKNKDGDLIRLFLDQYKDQDIENILNSLLHFFIFSNQNEEAAEVFKISDGYNIPDVFYTLLKDEGCLTDNLTDAFSEKKPKQSASDHKKAEYLINTHNKLLEKIDPEKYGNALYHLAHGLGKSLKPNKIFNKKITEENINEYIETISINLFSAFTEYFKKLYEIDEELKKEFIFCLEKIKEDFKITYDPQKKALITPKWPYDPINYYKQSDSIKKRYAICHCPWVRNSILENKKIHKDFCKCSVGFNKKTLFGDIEKDLPYEIQETVLNGSDRCVFLFYLSDFFEKGNENKP
ncbi:MAG: hypothetical protein MJB14_18145 [Spirochaetes bacterium]|nr:hypothetical protein [Spirochaetota bacterium]